MKLYAKSLITFLTVLIIVSSFSVFAQEEASVQIPQSWLDALADADPNSSAAIMRKYPDIPNDWSTEALVKAVQNGLLSGSDGKILPKDNLTRAQLATIMVRAFGATEEADVSGFVDLSSDKWYYKNMAISVAMGIFRGDGTGVIRPDDTITRQEVFTVISRAFSISGYDTSVLDSFPDKDDVADWAKDATASLIGNGYISGSGGYINPKNPITRAEFAQVMKNLVDTYINESGVYSQAPSGNIVVRVPGVVFNKAKFSGDVFVGEGAGNSFTITDSTSNDRIIIRGGKSTVITGTYNNIIVVGNGLYVDISAASVVNFVNNSESTITYPQSDESDSTLNND